MGEPERYFKFISSIFYTYPQNVTDEASLELFFDALKLIAICWNDFTKKVPIFKYQLEVKFAAQTRPSTQHSARIRSKRRNKAFSRCFLHVSLRLFVTVSDGQQSAIGLVMCLVFNLPMRDSGVVLFALWFGRAPLDGIERNQRWQAEPLINWTFLIWSGNGGIGNCSLCSDTPRILLRLLLLLSFNYCLNLSNDKNQPQRIGWNEAYKLQSITSFVSLCIGTALRWIHQSFKGTELLKLSILKNPVRMENETLLIRCYTHISTVDVRLLLLSASERMFYICLFSAESSGQTLPWRVHGPG